MPRMQHERLMRYMGGKSRIAPHLAKVILKSTSDRGIYLEPFVGGGAMFARMAPHFDLPVGGDAHPDVALMWQAVAEGWAPPSEVSEAEYAALKHAEPSALRGFVGFGCSFGGKWFGGYLRHGTAHGPGQQYDGQTEAQAAAGEASRWITKHAAVFAGCPALWCDYRALDCAVTPGAVVYCDPPYAGTTRYKGAPAFDHDTFWATMRAWATRGARVFVSEYVAPEDFRIAWEKPAPRAGLNSRAGVTERLFTHDG